MTSPLKHPFLQPKEAGQAGRAQQRKVAFWPALGCWAQLSLA